MKYIFTVLTLSLLSPQAFAHFSTLDTADVLPLNRYRLQLEPQIMSGNNSGTNLIGRFDMSLNSESGLKGVIGLGSLNFQAGGFYKWAPIPDINEQPAMALTVGLTYASDKDLIGARAYPIVSKKYNWELGIIKPYASLPISIAAKSGKSLFPVQLAIGAELNFPSIKDLDFYTEVGIDLKDSFNYISLGVATYFDENGHFIWSNP